MGPYKRNGKWVAWGKLLDGKRKYLGTFETKKRAEAEVEAYNSKIDGSKSPLLMAHVDDYIEPPTFVLSFSFLKKLFRK